MDVRAQLQLLAVPSALEPAEEADCVARPIGLANTDVMMRPAQRGLTTAHAPRRGDSSLEQLRNSLGVEYARMPGGKKIALLKSMLTSACERNCSYCCFRAGRDFRRATLSPDDFSKAFLDMYQKGIAEGLFLSSAVAGGGVRTQDRLLAVAEILRNKQGYRGYLHLKLMPGTEHEQVLAALRLADRVSLNLESPNADRLRTLAPQKVFMDELLQPLRWAEQIRRSQMPTSSINGYWPSLATQMVVGGAGESDLEILSTASYGIRQLRLKRVYFSAFSPVPDTPLQDHAPENPWREHRLYQASYLLRDYGFELEDFPFKPSGFLPLEVDPKLGWAREHLGQAPVEINRADRRSLLRIPGIGPQSVETILRARRAGRLKELRDLQKLGILASRAAPFILLDGRRPAYQLRLM
jgi:predicted DNA-binding helix-hairpin-helix protein